MVIGDKPETRWVLGLREPPETFFRQQVQLSGGFSSRSCVFLRSIRVGGELAFACATGGLVGSFCLFRRLSRRNFIRRRTFRRPESRRNFSGCSFSHPLRLVSPAVELVLSFLHSCAMIGGSARAVVVESKRFDLRVVGRNGDILKISEQGRGRSFAIFLPEPVVFWLLRAWGRFRKSKSANWCNRMRLSSRLFMLDSKSNIAGKFLKLSVSKEGNRAFVIFPAGWNEKGWDRIFDSIAGIMGQPSGEPVLLRKGNSAHTLLPGRAPTGAPLPPPPLGGCPQCGFTGEPACFLRSYAGAVSSSTSTEVLGSSSSEFLAGEPISAREAQGKAEYPALSLLYGKKSGYAKSQQQNQVYVRRRVQGPSTTANGEGSGEYRRGVQRLGDGNEPITKWPFDAFLVSEFSLSSSDKALSTDPAWFEALINGQVHRELQLVSDRTRGGAGSLAQKSCAAVASLDPSTQVAISTPLRLPWFSSKSHLASALEADPLHNAVPMGLQSSLLGVEWGLDLHTNFPRELPGEVFKDALMLSLSNSGNSSDAEFLETPLAVDFSFQQRPMDSFSAAGIWEDGKVDSMKVSKWVAAKLKGVAACLGVAFDGYEDEVANLLARIERNSVSPKPSVPRTPSAVRRQRELKRLEFGVNYEKAGSSSSGMLVPYV